MPLNTGRLSKGHRRLASVGLVMLGLVATSWALAAQPAAQVADAPARAQQASQPDSVTDAGEQARTMRVHYLEIVTPEVDAICATYEKALGVEFGDPIAAFGNARTATLPDGGMVGVRAPMRETEAPVVRPYWLVDDINAAIAAAEKAGGQVAIPPMEIPEVGTFAIYLQGGIDHGLWQK